MLPAQFIFISLKLKEIQINNTENANINVLEENLTFLKFK